MSSRFQNKSFLLRRATVFVGTVLTLMVVFTTSAQAVDTNTSAVTGKVVDAAGIPQAGVNLTFSQQETADKFKATTDSNGAYTVQLPVGTFAVSGKGTTAIGIVGATATAPIFAVEAGKPLEVPPLAYAPKKLSTLPVVLDKAVYYDDKYATGWVSDSAARQIRDYFKGKGYTVVDAAGLADFISAHQPPDWQPNVVVFAQDSFPDTVLDVSDGVIGNQSLLRYYLTGGGRAVYFGAAPFYSFGLSGGATVETNADSAKAILGFDSAGGTKDLGDATVLTPAGAALGLTATWHSQRPIKPIDADVILESSKGGAAGWIRFYPDTTGSNMFIRLLDETPEGGKLSDAQLADALHLAELSGPFPVPTAPAVTPGDVNGDGKVDLKDATLSLQLAVGSLTPTGAQSVSGDINKDGKIDLKDTTLILKVALGGTL